MERPQKKPRLGLAPHDESDDDDELNYEPEEIARKRDPNARLARSRANAAFGLKSAFESIFERYERDFEGVADEIDLFSGDIVINNRHLQRMRNEKDMGLVSGEAEEDGISLHDSDAVAGGVTRTGNGASSGGDNDEDQILQGRSSALVHKASGALVPRVPSVMGQRPGLGSLGGPPQLPPFGASPLFFGSWGPPGAMEPAWQAPQLQIPQFKSSFGANLFTGRYQLPAREASKSIWGPGSGGDEDEDEPDEPDEAPRMRLAPPTRRVPARPKAMKLIRAAPANAGDSGDEDCILMDMDTSLVSSTTPTSPSQQFETRASADGSGVPSETDSDVTKFGKKTEREKKAVPFTTSSSLTVTRELAEQPMSNLSVASQPSVTKERKNSPANKRRRGRPSQPRKSLVVAEESQESLATKPAESTPLTNHNTSQATIRNSSKVFVVEIRSNHLLNNSDCLDFLDMTDLPVDSSPSPVLPDDSVTLPPEDNLGQVTTEPEHNLDPVIEAPEANLDQITAEAEANLDQATAESKDSIGQVTTEPDDILMLSDRTIPDSQELPISLPSSSAQKRPMERPPERPRHNKKKPSAYDFSDEEVGFLSRPAQRRKRTSNVALSATNEEPAPISTAPTASIDTNTHAREPQLAEPSPPSASELATRDSSGSLISPVKTRSARAKMYSSNRLSHSDSRSNEAENPVDRVPGKRKLTPTSLASADETESERVPAQAGTDSSLSVAPISPPPENEAISNSAETANHGDVEVETYEPMADVAATHDGDAHLPRSTRSKHELPTRRKTRRTVKELGNAPTAVPGDTSTTEDNLSGTTNPTPWEPQTTAGSKRAATADVATATSSLSPSSPGTHLSLALGDAVDASSANRVTRRRAGETGTSRGPSSEVPAPSFAAETSAGPALGHRLPDEPREPATSTTPRREPHARTSAGDASSSQPKLTTPSRTPKNKLPISGTPNSALSTGHRSLTSLVPEKESLDNDSEDELTASSLWSLFQKPTPALPSSGKSLRRKRGPEETPTKAKKRVSAVRLSSGLSLERPSGWDESVMRTPGGTIRKCGERGLKCGKDFCFTCC